MPITYSWTEARLLHLLRLHQVSKRAPTARVTSTKLTELFYFGGGSPPQHGGVIVTNAMRSLADKAIRKREPFRVKRDEHRRPISFWIEYK